MDLSSQWESTCKSAAAQWGTELLFAAIITAVHGTAFWGGIAYYKALSGVKELDKYKIQHPARERGNSEELVRKAVVDGVVGSWVVVPVLCYGFAWWLGFGGDLCEPLPGWGVFAVHLIVSILFTDSTFYWAHRALHHKSLYSWIHKQHHEFKATIPLASEYDHPIEDAVNTLTTIGGPLLLHSHPLFLAFYIAFRVFQTIDAHSGYSLPPPYSPWNIGVFWSSALRHDYHHTENIGNYGDWLPIWDYICGTDKSWKRYQQKEAKA